VVPEFCVGPFWNELFELMLHVGASVITLMREKPCRERAFAQQQDRIPDSDWNCSHRERHVIRPVCSASSSAKTRSRRGIAHRAALTAPANNPLPRKRGRAGGETSPNPGLAPSSPAVLIGGFVLSRSQPSQGLILTGRLNRCAGQRPALAFARSRCLRRIDR